MVGEFNGLEEKQLVLINETQRNTADHFQARIHNDPFAQTHQAEANSVNCTVYIQNISTLF